MFLGAFLVETLVDGSIALHGGFETHLCDIVVVTLHVLETRLLWRSDIPV